MLFCLYAFQIFIHVTHMLAISNWSQNPSKPPWSMVNGDFIQILLICSLPIHRETKQTNTQHTHTYKQTPPTSQPSIAFGEAMHEKDKVDQRLVFYHCCDGSLEPNCQNKSINFSLTINHVEFFQVTHPVTSCYSTEGKLNVTKQNLTQTFSRKVC